MPRVSADEIIERIAHAVCDLYRMDGQLFMLDAHEQAVTHKLAEHLQREFPGWHVDCEYNRDKSGVKREGRAAGSARIRPDIIVHRRDTDDNLLAIEAKTHGNGPTEADLRKLHNLASPGPDGYGYGYGLFLRLGPNSCLDVHLYSRGQRANDASTRLASLLQKRLAGIVNDEQSSAETTSE